MVTVHSVALLALVIAQLVRELPAVSEPGAKVGGRALHHGFTHAVLHRLQVPRVAVAFKDLLVLIKSDSTCMVVTTTRIGRLAAHTAVSHEHADAMFTCGKMSLVYVSEL
jgi:hypothetical protein